MRKFFSFKLRWNDGVYDFLLENFNLENEGLRCCWWGEVKLIQNSSFLFHSHYSPRLLETKVGKNTFRAFTGKLEKPINWRCRGGDASLEGWMILMLLENDQSECELRIRYQPSDYFLRDVPGGAQKIIEKNPVLFLLLTKALHQLFCMWDMMRKDDCPVRLFAQRLAESLYLPFSPILSRRRSFSHSCQPCLWDETEFLSALQHYCLLASLAQWPPFCQTFRARLESFKGGHLT